MIDMQEIRINSSRFVQAPALFEQGKELYRSKGFAEAHALVYDMFPGIDSALIESILSGEIESYVRGSTVIYFLESEVTHER